MSRSNTLTEIWNTYNNNILSENAPGEKAAKMGTKPGKPPAKPNDVKHGFANDNSSGPENADKGEIYGNVIDPKHNGVEDELYNSEIYSSQEYNKKNKKLEKKVKESINNNMKSTFDKLFENVMGEEMHSDQETQELDALGIDTEVADTESDEVTITLDREMVKKIILLKWKKMDLKALKKLKKTTKTMMMKTLIRKQMKCMQFLIVQVQV